jgi:hypothetical protein
MEIPFPRRIEQSLASLFLRSKPLAVVSNLPFFVPPTFMKHLASPLREA